MFRISYRLPRHQPSSSSNSIGHLRVVIINNDPHIAVTARSVRGSGFFVERRQQKRAACSYTFKPFTALLPVTTRVAYSSRLVRPIKCAFNSKCFMEQISGSENAPNSYYELTTA